jgi:hypothetical protein
MDYLGSTFLFCLLLVFKGMVLCYHLWEQNEILYNQGKICNWSKAKFQKIVSCKNVLGACACFASPHKWTSWVHVMVLQVHLDVGGHYKLGLKRMNPTKWSSMATQKERGQMKNSSLISLNIISFYVGGIWIECGWLLIVSRNTIKSDKCQGTHYETTFHSIPSYLILVIIFGNDSKTQFVLH